MNSDIKDALGKKGTSGEIGDRLRREKEPALFFSDVTARDTRAFLYEGELGSL